MFYVQDPYDERWLVVLHTKNIGVNVEGNDSTLHTCHSPFSTHIPGINGEDEVDVVHENHNDHDEGELINIVYCNLFLYILVSIFTIT